MDYTDSLFDGLIGNDAAGASLIEDYRAQRLAGAYLLHGPASVGKRAYAMALTKAANCRQSTPEEPKVCGECPSCKKIDGGNHSWIHLLEPEDLSLAKPSIKIEAVRGVMELLSLKLAGEGRQFLIVDPAEAMTNAAANALLKTLEEPPPDTTLLLICAHPHKLLPTVISRCRQVRFRPIPRRMLTQNLADEHGMDAEAANLSAELSGGTFMMAGSDDPDFALRLREESLELFDRLTAGDLNEAILMAQGWMKQEGALALLLPLWESLIRDATMIALGRRSEEERAADPEALVAYANRYGPRRLTEIFDRISRTRVGLFDRNANREQSLATLFLSMTPGLE